MPERKFEERELSYCAVSTMAQLVNLMLESHGSRVEEIHFVKVGPGVYRMKIKLEVEA